MKKISLTVILLLTYVYPRDISPVISIRYDQINNEIVITDAIGLKFKLGDDKFTGYDTDGTDHRLYVGWKFGKIGFENSGLKLQRKGKL